MVSIPSSGIVLFLRADKTELEIGDSTTVSIPSSGIVLLLRAGGDLFYEPMLYG